MLRIPYPMPLGTSQTQKNGYLFAGKISDPTNHNTQYNSVSQSWLVRTAIPSPTRFGCGCSKVGTDQVLIASGSYSSDTCKLYSIPATDSWTNVAVVLAPYGRRVDMASNTVGTGALITGGYTYWGGLDNNELWTYGTPGSWSARTSMNVTRYRMTGVTVGTLNYMFGGFDGEYKSEVREFNNTTNSFAFKTESTIPFGLAVGNYVNNSIFIMGGSSSSGASDQNELFLNNTWTAQIPLTFARTASGGFSNHSKLHVVGGANSTDINVNSNDEYCRGVWSSRTNFIYSERDLRGVGI